MREKTIEKKLVQAVKSEGGMCPKLVSPGTDGMPDRMVLLPEARIGFVEVKAPGAKPRLTGAAARATAGARFSGLRSGRPGTDPRHH